MTKQTTEQFMEAHGFEWEPETEFFKPGIWTYKMPGTAEFSLTNVQAEFMHRICQEAEAAARAEAVMAIMDVTTEGLYDDGDLFIKRAPIEQAIINLVGYERFKAIQESLPPVVKHQGDHHGF